MAARSVTFKTVLVGHLVLSLAKRRERVEKEAQVRGAAVLCGLRNASLMFAGSKDSTMRSWTAQMSWARRPVEDLTARG